MVGLDRIMCDTLNDLLTIQHCLVGQDLVTLCLTEHLIGEHGSRNLVCADHPHLLPAELVGAREADVVALRTGEEHEALEDLRVAHDAVG